MGLTACRLGYVVGECPHMHLLLEMEYATKWCLVTCMQAVQQTAMRGPRSGLCDGDLHCGGPQRFNAVVGAMSEHLLLM